MKKTKKLNNDKKLLTNEALKQIIGGDGYQWTQKGGGGMQLN